MSHIKVKGNASGTGTVTLEAPNTSTDRTITLPDATGTVVHKDASGDVSFADGDKAIFGAGSDLQIYHDGSNSYISEVGAGNLRVRGTNNVYLQVSADGGSTWENAVICDADAAVTLRYNNSNKLATTSTGIDVTGTVTADGLTVDGNSLLVATDAVTNASSIGLDVRHVSTGTTANNFGVGLSLSVENSTYSSTPELARIESISTDEANVHSNLYIYTKYANSLDKRIAITDDGDISFYEDTGTTAKFFWDASAEALALAGGVTLGNGTTYNAANTLDDYEEGTWTPVVGGGSVSDVDGYYTKVGRCVTIVCTINNQTISGSSGGTITGLPFTNGGSRSATGFVNHYNLFPYDNVGGLIEKDNTQVIFLRMRASTSWQGASFSNGSNRYLHFQAVYYTDY